MFIENKKTVADIVSDLKRTTGDSYSSIKNQHYLMFQTIWNNHDFTPEEILAQFGTEAKELFVVSSLTQQLLQTIDPSYEPLVPPKSFIINSDGTVTIQ